MYQEACEPFMHDFHPAPSRRTQNDRQKGLGVMLCTKCRREKRGRFQATNPRIIDPAIVDEEESF